MFEKKIMYNENALNWFHAKGYKCDTYSAYLYAVYSGTINSMKWLRNHVYVCNDDFNKWSYIDEDYFVSMLDNNLIKKGF